MPITLSVVFGILAGWVSYQILFYDHGDFWLGCGKFLSRMSRRRGPADMTPEHFEDEGWSSGIRFFLFLAVSLGSAYCAYVQWPKHFG